MSHDLSIQPAEFDASFFSVRLRIAPEKALLLIDLLVAGKLPQATLIDTDYDTDRDASWVGGETRDGVGFTIDVDGILEVHGQFTKEDPFDNHDGTTFSTTMSLQDRLDMAKAIREIIQ